ASFPRRAESVFGARVALINAAQGWNQSQHAIEIILADVKRNVNRAAMSFRPVRQCRDRVNAKQLVIGELEKRFAVIFTHRSKAEGFGIKSLRALQVGRFEDHVAEANIAKRLAVHADFYVVVVKIGEAKRAPEWGAA